MGNKLYYKSNHKLSEFNTAELWILDEIQVFGLLGSQQFLGQLPKLSLLQEHDCKLEMYNSECTHWSDSIVGSWVSDAWNGESDSIVGR